MIQSRYAATAPVVSCRGSGCIIPKNLVYTINVVETIHPQHLPEAPAMTYVISEPCIDVLDRGCVDECPVDCIYEGGRALYIQPDECVDCGACEPVCPVEAIYYEDDLPDDLEPYAADNSRFFTETLPGLDEPLGSPGGADRTGVIGVDTELVATHAVREEANQT